MNDELLSLQVVVVSNSKEDHDLFRQALSTASVPIEVQTADGAAAARNGLCVGADLLYLDEGLAPTDLARIVAAARAQRNPPFTVLLTGKEDSGPFHADALAGKPTQLYNARRFIERSIRVRLPSRVLVVDDSPIVRSIVRKLLAQSRFPFDVSEADAGFAALKLVRERAIDMAFLDHNMPDFSGLETLSELKREKRRVNVVIMTSQADRSPCDRAREEGAAFLRKPFYPADIEAILCSFYGLRALNPQRA
jgi:CheY-like chemotaxis protein